MRERSQNSQTNEFKGLPIGAAGLEATQETLLASKEYTWALGGLDKDSSDT